MFTSIGNIVTVDSNVESPLGTPAAAAQHRRRADRAYRAAQAGLAPYEGIARLVILRRSELGLTQSELARRMNTSHSAISRLESGQHRTSLATLERLARALEVRFVLGFETGPRDAPVRDLVSL